MCWARPCSGSSAGTSATRTSACCVATPSMPRYWGCARWSAKTRCGAISARLTKQRGSPRLCQRATARRTLDSRHRCDGQAALCSSAGAVVGYNSHKPGRPSHTDHTAFIANRRLVLDVEVQPGNQRASKYSSPGRWERLGRIPRTHGPAFIRGDRDWGTLANMARAEQENIDYLSKLRLARWSRARRAVVPRRRGKQDLAVVDAGNPEPLRLSNARAQRGGDRLCVCRAGDLARGRDPNRRPTLPRSCRRREPVRRAEEPLGPGRIDPPRSQTLPLHGAHDRTGLAQVAPVRVPGRSRPAQRSPPARCGGTPQPGKPVMGDRSAPPSLIRMPRPPGWRAPVARARRSSSACAELRRR